MTGTPEQFGDAGQVVDVFAGVEHIVSGRNTAHRPESRTRDALSEALGEDIRRDWLRNM